MVSRESKRVVGLKVVGGKESTESWVLGVSTDLDCVPDGEPHRVHIDNTEYAAVRSRVRSLYSDIVERHVLRDSVVGVGVDIGGWVDVDGRVVKIPAFQWADNRSLQADLVRDLGGRVPVAVVNDSNALAVFELLFSTAPAGEANRGNFVVVLLTESGIGGGVVLNGELQAGASGVSGELGHVKVLASGGQPCGCGGTGCLETLATPSAMGGEPGRPAVSAAAAGDALGFGLSSLINILNPDTVIVYGQPETTGATAQTFQLNIDQFPSQGEYVDALVTRMRRDVLATHKQACTVRIQTASELAKIGPRAAAAAAIYKFDR